MNPCNWQEVEINRLYAHMPKNIWIAAKEGHKNDYNFLLRAVN